MKNIKVMDMALANTIAAGEVVERPASVIKELVENSIDANAKNIVIEVNQMGLESIIVTDDGDGMTKDNLKKAFLRHATSKISEIKDLNDIHTLGFRGEALPSILSVAQIEITSRTLETDAYYLKLENNQIVDEGPRPLNKGTKIKVSSLFYNTPARFKYMKSEYAEKNAISDIFERLSLSHPDISFKLMMDQKLIKSTLGNNNIPQLLESIYGKNITQGMKHLNTTISKIGIDAYLIDPKYVRSRRNDVSIFINSRYVKNYALSQAIIDGYTTFLMTNKFPISLLYITIDPSLVDVNVHPQKMEVKLANERMLSFMLAPEVRKSLEGGSFPIRQTLPEIKKEAFKPQIIDLFEFASNQTHEDNQLQEQAFDQLDNNNNNEVMKLPHLEYIGTLSGTYLLYQNNEGLYLMDQHAAAERIRYEYYENNVAKLSSDHYELLVPKDLFITSKDYEILSQNSTKLRLIGLEFKDEKLTTHPTWLRDSELDIIIESVIDQLKNTQKIDLKELRNQLAKDISCKGAIKANQQLSINEINKLESDLRNCNNPYTCPHGRPVLIKLSNQDIEKMFKRIV
ncbi:DNA mismatch repair endonuclease MutL [Acholeplasma granularum]|uniref:DNA mismatch repair endonuclease MutL n=1 Tax=Acholeplasma granularum TaxID=264635 RepID=UPI0004AF236B|nr:DNA mismatch repair endonuclease MutL [Acholeplasma granularum]